MCLFPMLSLCEYQASGKNYEPCLQLSHGRSLYYGQIGSHVVQRWNCCLQPKPPFYVLLTLFPRLCQSVHSIQNCNQHSRPCEQHFCTTRQRVCLLVSGKEIQLVNDYGAN